MPSTKWFDHLHSGTSMPSRGRPPHHWNITTFTGALRTTDLTASFVHDGAMSGVVFQAYSSFFMTAGPVSDYTGAAVLLDSRPITQWTLADRGYDADWFRNALKEKGIKPCTPGRRSRSKPVRYDKRKYKRRNRIEIMCGRLEDWRRVATRYDRCPVIFLSAICLAATVMFWLRVLSQTRHKCVSV